MLKAFAAGRLFGERTGTAPPWVLALHGWRREHSDFAAVVAGLDAIALDLPGFGASPPPADAWGSAEYAGLVAEVLDEMASSVVVAGHSLGGRVAVHLAAARPDRVAALVLTGAPLVRVDRGRGQTAPLAFRIGRALHRHRLFPDGRMERLRQRYGSADYRAAEGVMRAVLVRMVNESYDDVIPRVSVPVELVWGDDDTAAPLEGARELERRFPDARLVVVPGAGHLTPTTVPHDIRAAIERHRP